jgi:hypothetical protein
MKYISRPILEFLGLNVEQERECCHLSRVTFELESINELSKLFGWSKQPILLDEEIYKTEHIVDLNERRLRDAESIGTVVRNANPVVCLEIGTAEGRSTALLADNAPQEAQIYTVNIDPEEILTGEGGVLTTIAMEHERIGSYYRSKRYKNITQIIANTANWKPNIGFIDVALIDGCHDTEFVYNDTKKVLAHARKGSFILWHDFHPGLQKQFPWIHDVCKGVDRLIQDGLVQGNIYHVHNSWIGIYQVQEK